MNLSRSSRAFLTAALGLSLPLVALGAAPAQAAYAGPANLQVVAPTVGGVRLDWGDVAGAPGYRVRYSTSASMAASKAAWFRASTGTVTGLRPGTTYYFTTAVSRQAGRALGSYTPAPYPSAVPRFATPTSVRKVAADTSSATLAWGAVAGAPGYRVQWSRSTDMSNASSAWFSTAQGQVKGLQAGTTYFFDVAVARQTGAALSAFTASPHLQVATLRSAAPTAPVLTPVPGSFDLQASTFNISTINVDGSSPVHDPWALRKSVVARQLLGLSPGDQTGPSADVVALQEANTSLKIANNTLSQLTDLLATMNGLRPRDENYVAVPGSSQSTRIIYNSTDLQLVTNGVLTWTDQETAADGIRSMPWAILKVRTTGARFFFSSAHLETASEPIRRAQWAELIARVPALSQGLPVVTGGDFNSPRGAASQCPAPSNPTASVMLPRMRPAGFADTLGQEACGADLISTSRAARVVNGNINSVNWWVRALNYYTKTDWIGQQVDYLFASNGLAVKRWEQVIDHENYSVRGVIPSDHNMIRATVTLPAA